MINDKKLRKIIGWLGMLLPWIVVILSLVYNFSFPESISATYYVSTCITPFMIVLGSAGLLLICYNGYDKQDAIICTIAGIFGLGICLFPCKVDALTDTAVGTFNLPINVSNILHCASAIIFFGLLAYNSMFLFTKSSGIMTDKKKKRNVIFKICGIGMIASFILLPVLKLVNFVVATWFIETIALTFFGISWLTKAQCYRWLYKD